MPSRKNVVSPVAVSESQSDDTLVYEVAPKSRFSPVFARRNRDDKEAAPVIYEEVVAQIKALLQEGQYRPGDKLPSERELSERMGVNRNAVREAIRALTLLGVIQTRPQSGSHLSSQLEGMLRLPFEFLMLMLRPTYAEIQELRGLLEIYAAGRAAERRTDVDIQRIEEALEELRVTSHHLGSSGGPNRKFHRAIAAATHNRLLEYLLYCLLEARSAYIRAISPIGTGRRENNDNHEKLLTAIKRGDVTTAQQAMRDDMGVAKEVGAILHALPPME